jgi:hypothetical protein
MPLEQVMGLTGDRYEGSFKGHPIEVVRNEWIKTLKLLIDGNVVASKFCPLPSNVTLTARLKDGIKEHVVVVKSVIRFPFYEDTVEVDGRRVALNKTR